MKSILEFAEWVFSAREVAQRAESTQKCDRAKVKLKRFYTSIVRVVVVFAYL